MCGKYILAQAAKAERALGIRRGRWEYPLSYRVLPSEEVPVVVSEEGEREATLMRWGLVPYWANGVPLKASTINARAERIESAPSYRDPWERGQRCLLIIHGKGRRSKNQEPVLRGKVAGWLAQRAEVLAFSQARPPDGGSGAVAVLLRGPKARAATPDDDDEEQPG